MTNKEAIEILKAWYLNQLEPDKALAFDKAFKMAVKALMKEAEGKTEVLESIKEKIENESFKYYEPYNDYCEGVRYGLVLANQIINNHLRGGQSGKSMD